MGVIVAIAGCVMNMLHPPRGFVVVLALAGACVLVGMTVVPSPPRQTAVEQSQWASALDVSDEPDDWTGSTSRPLGEPYVAYDRGHAVKPGMESAHRLAMNIWRGLESHEPDRRNTRDGSDLTFGLAWVAQAYVTMFEATGDERYLRQAGDDIDYMLSVRDDKTGAVDEVRGRVVKSWGTRKDTGGMQPQNVGKRHTLVLFAGNICQPIARWAYVVLRDPALRQRYGERAGRYVQAVEETIAEYDGEWREFPRDGENAHAARYGFAAHAGEGYYYCPVTGDPMAYNRQNAMGRTLVAMYLATRRQEYADKTVRLAKYFRRAMRVASDGGYLWYGSFWNRGTARIEDAGHAATSVQFIVDVYDADLGFGAGDLDRLERTFERFTRRSRDGTVVGWWFRVDGTDAGKQFLTDGAAGLWAYLGRRRESVVWALASRPEAIQWMHPCAWQVLSTVQRPRDEPVQ